MDYLIYIIFATFALLNVIFNKNKKAGLIIGVAALIAAILIDKFILK